MRNTKLYILTFIVIILIASVCIPVFAKNNNSYYTGRIAGNSVYVAIGNIGHVQPNSDVTIPVYVGSNDAKITAYTYFIEFNPNDSIELVDVQFANNSLECDPSDDECIHNSVNTTGCTSLFNPWDDNITVSLCSSREFNANGILFYLNLHTKSNFTGDNVIKFTHIENFLYPTGSAGKLNQPVIHYNGVISSGDVYNDVTFVDWSGTVLDKQRIISGTAPTGMPTPHRLGYEFAGWNQDINNLKSDAIIFPEYTPREYTVEFEFNYSGVGDGFNIEPVTQNVQYGEAAIAPSFPDGYTCTFDKDYSFIDSDMNVIGTCVPETVTP